MKEISQIKNELDNLLKQRKEIEKRCFEINRDLLNKVIELAKAKIKEEQEQEDYFLFIKYNLEYPKNRFDYYDLGTILLNDEIYYGLEITTSKLSMQDDLDYVSEILDDNVYLIVIFNGALDEADYSYREIGLIKVKDIKEKLFSKDIILFSYYLLG